MSVIHKYATYINIIIFIKLHCPFILQRSCCGSAQMNSHENKLEFAEYFVFSGNQ